MLSVSHIMQYSYMFLDPHSAHVAWVRSDSFHSSHAHPVGRLLQTYVHLSRVQTSVIFFLCYTTHSSTVPPDIIICAFLGVRSAFYFSW